MNGSSGFKQFRSVDDSGLMVYVWIFMAPTSSFSVVCVSAVGLHYRMSHALLDKLVVTHPTSGDLFLLVL